MTIKVSRTAGKISKPEAMTELAILPQATIVITL